MTRFRPFRARAALSALCACAMLAACTTTPAPAATTLRLQGQTTGVTFTDSVLYLASGDAVNLDNPGSLTSAGTLSLTTTVVPPAASAFDLLTVPAGCTVSGPVQAHPRVHFYDRLVVRTPQGDALGTVREVITAGGTLPFSRVARVYSDRAAVVRATVQCGTAAGVVYDVTLARGWNAVEYAVASNSVTLRTLGRVTTEFQAEQNLPYITAVFSPQTLTFTSNTTVQVAATFYQDGGLGGTYTLNTDTPGLSVEPATVTLEGIEVLSTRPGGALLSRLGLGAQALSRTLTFTYTGTASGPFVVSLDDDSGQQMGRGDGVLDVRRP